MGFLANEFPDKLLNCECKECNQCFLCDRIARNSHKASRKLFFKKDYSEQEYRRLMHNIGYELFMQNSQKYIAECYDNEYGEFLKCYDKIFLPSGLLKSFLGGERFMKKIKFILCILVLMIGTMGFCISAYADEFSDNTQELVFTPSKVWKSGNNLCVTGTFYNTKSDRLIVKIKSFNPNITFKKADGSSFEFTNEPIKFPLCTIKPGTSKTITYNFGEFNEEWDSWTADPRYVYQYRDIFI